MMFLDKMGAEGHGRRHVDMDPVQEVHMVVPRIVGAVRPKGVQKWDPSKVSGPSTVCG